MIPAWLHILSIASLLLGAGCAVVLAIDLVRHPQHMWIMNVVWPVTALYAGPLALWGYYRYGRAHGDKLFPAAVGIGATHCGAGCCLGDICAEWLVVAAPAVALWFGWQSLFQDKMFAVWIVDFIFAFVFGIVFQYFSIAPMRGLSLGPGVVAALKADTLSLTAWQVGMYGAMAVAQFYIFQTLLQAHVDATHLEFWFAMQIAMLAGFVVSYPVNWWLIAAGIKEKM